MMRRASRCCHGVAAEATGWHRGCAGLCSLGSSGRVCCHECVWATPPSVWCQPPGPGCSGPLCRPPLLPSSPSPAAASGEACCCPCCCCWLAVLSPPAAAAASCTLGKCSVVTKKWHTIEFAAWAAARKLVSASSWGAASMTAVASAATAASMNSRSANKAGSARLSVEASRRTAASTTSPSARSLLLQNSSAAASERIAASATCLSSRSAGAANCRAQPHEDSAASTTSRSALAGGSSSSRRKPSAARADSTNGRCCGPWQQYCRRQAVVRRRSLSLAVLLLASAGRIMLLLPAWWCGSCCCRCCCHAFCNYRNSNVMSQFKQSSLMRIDLPPSDGPCAPRERANLVQPDRGMQEVARYLQLASQDCAQQGDGLSALLHALRLGCALRSESASDPLQRQQLQQLELESSRLIAKATASQAMADARTERFGGLPAQVPLLQPCGQLLTNDWSGLLDAGSKAKQLLAQGAAALQQKLLQQAQQQSAAASGQRGQHPAAAAGRKREISVPVKERKRDADGLVKQQRGAAQPATAALDASSAAAAASNRWSSTACKRVASAAGAPGSGGGRGGGRSSGDAIEVDDDGDDEIEDPQDLFLAGARAQQQGRQQQQQPGGGFFTAAGAAAGGGQDDAGGGRSSGFKSAKQQYASDLCKKGQHQQAAAMFNKQAPRAGLTRPRGRGGHASGPAAGGASRSGFVPPFVGKAIDQHTGSDKGGGGGGGGAAAGGEEGVLSAHTLEMLGVSCDSELPAELAKHDLRLIEQVCNDVIDASGGVAWDDIAGLETAKHLIKEIVVWPMLNPKIFTGPRAPPKGILLFGPPGTGKTLIGKAVASNISAAFFSISASSLTSKWIGEGEKMVKTLFAVAAHLQPSVIFIDEIDSILSARKSEGEHEASRRLKTEMLVQMEGCDPASASRRVLLVGATNRPEELDEAARRRMPKQLYIPLPCAEARHKMLLRQLGPGGKVSAELSACDLDKIVAKTDGYSGSDMRNLIQEACQGPVRAAVARVGEAVAALSDADLRPVRLKDFQHAAKAQRASVTAAEIRRYAEYNDRHGAKYVLQQQEGQEEAELEGDDDW